MRMVNSDNNVAVSRHSRIEMVLAQQYCYIQKLKLMKQQSGTVNSIKTLQANACSKRLKYGLYYSFRLFPFICFSLQCRKYSHSFKFSPRNQNEPGGEEFATISNKVFTTANDFIILIALKVLIAL